MEIFPDDLSSLNVSLLKKKKSLVSTYPNSKGLHINSELQIIVPYFFFKYPLRNDLHLKGTYPENQLFFLSISG